MGGSAEGRPDEEAGERLPGPRVLKGPGVVLPHGTWEDGRAWRPQLEGLREGFRAVA
jgi:hypothetical protein